MAGVTIKGLGKTYSAAAGIPAVSDLDLVIGDNQFVTLLGPSGCGKTTTLRLIAGYLKPDAGTIHVGDRLLSSKDHVVLPEDRGMGMVFQNYAVWPHKTVYENVVFGLRVRKVPTAAARRAGAQPGGRAGDPAARRAAQQPRCEAARAHAHRAEAAAAAHRHHLHLCHPRPGRGARFVRPNRGD